MNYRRNHPRGQALVLIVLAIVGMVGITALAVDGGSVYSDRRHAQNAADTAALAAGLARIRQSPSDPVDAWRAVGYQRATDNGYPQAGPTSTVVVSLCSDTGVTCTLPATVDDGTGHPIPTEASQFVKVSIVSIVHTYFAPIVGIRQITNGVEAIVRAIPSQETHYFDGAALASTMPSCKYPGWPNDPFVVGGNSTTVVTGAELFVNANCDPDPDIVSNLSGGGSLTAAEGICLVGSYDPGNINGVSPTPTNHCAPQQDWEEYAYPDVDTMCADLGPGHIDNIGGVLTAYPGKYSHNFPAQYAQPGTLKILRGLYCLDGGFNLHSGQWNITTDLNDNGLYDNSSEGALFYVSSGDVAFNGSSTLNIHAVTSSTCSQNGLDGLLIYLPKTNTSTVSINGGSNSTFTGTILAPRSLVTLAGGGNTASDAVELRTQIIGYSISIGGSGYLNINYNPCVTSTTYTQPALQPYK